MSKSFWNKFFGPEEESEISTEEHKLSEEDKEKAKSKGTVRGDPIIDI